MKKISVFLTILLASLLLSALPTLSSSGPFGTIGPSNYADLGFGGETHLVGFVRGTGPYGSIGGFIFVPEVVSEHITSGGTGPYGAFTSYGLMPNAGSTSVGNNNGCILLAKNCYPDK